MSRMLRMVPFVLLAITGVFAVAPRTDVKNENTLTIFFDHKVGKEPLQLDVPVKIITGDTVSIERFRYYVSNFSITTHGKKIVLPAAYYLIDEALPLSKQIGMAIPSIASIDSIHFLLGVDSIKNVSGVQTDALDPSHGMFWTWNSGYVMAKLEGSCEAIEAAGHRFTFHVGGFRKGMNTARMIHLAFASPTNTDTVHITTDINRWFNGKTKLDIKETPVCHSPGALAVRIADNYAHQFSINAGN